MSGRRDLVQAAALTEVPVFLMDAATGEGVTGVDPGDTGFVVRYRRAGETADTPLTLTAVAASAGIAVNQWRDYGDGWYSVVGSVAMYAAGARFVKLAVDCTTPAALADVCVVALSADDGLSASETGASIASAVWASGTRTLTSFGTLVADTASAVWSAVSRTLTSGGGSGGATASEVWAFATRTLTSSLAPTAAENAAATDAVIAPRFAAIPAAPTPAANAAAVEAALLDNFDALPTASEIAAAVAAPSAAAIAAAVAAPSAGVIAAAVAAPSASAIAAAVAAPAAGTIATAVRGALAPDFAAIPTPPTASQVSTQTVADLAGVPGIPARAAIADKLLLRNHEGGDDAGRSVSSALAGNRNRVERSGNTVTVYRADDVTVLYTAIITTDAALLPVAGINPT